jgi:cytochrome c
MGTVLRRLILPAILAIGLSGHAVGSDARGTAEEAKAMVARAIAAYDEKGEAVFADITAPSTMFIDRDLYVFVVGPDRRNVAHGADAGRVGVDLSTAVDVDGKPYGQEFFAKATEEGAWVDYKWKDPLTGQVQPKSSWVVRHDGYIFGCGIYTE